MGAVLGVVSALGGLLKGKPSAPAIPPAPKAPPAPAKVAESVESAGGGKKKRRAPVGKSSLIIKRDQLGTEGLSGGGLKL